MLPNFQIIISMGAPWPFLLEKLEKLGWAIALESKPKLSDPGVTSYPSMALLVFMKESLII